MPLSITTISIKTLCGEFGFILCLCVENYRVAGKGFIYSLTVFHDAEWCYVECLLCWVSLYLMPCCESFCWMMLWWLSLTLSMVFIEVPLCSMSYIILSVIYVECHICWVLFMFSVFYVECHLCWVSFMLSVIYVL